MIDGPTPKFSPIDAVWIHFHQKKAIREDNVLYSPSIWNNLSTFF